MPLRLRLERTPDAFRTASSWPYADGTQVRASVAPKYANMATPASTYYAWIFPASACLAGPEGRFVTPTAHCTRVLRRAVRTSLQPTNRQCTTLLTALRARKRRDIDCAGPSRSGTRPQLRLVFGPLVLWSSTSHPRDRARPGVTDHMLCTCGVAASWDATPTTMLRGDGDDDAMSRALALRAPDGDTGDGDGAWQSGVNSGTTPAVSPQRGPTQAANTVQEPQNMTGMLVRHAGH